MVFLCHDITDIFMEAAKMSRYAEHKWLPTALFVVFMLSWFTSRIYYFPVYVIRSVYYEPINVRPSDACLTMTSKDITACRRTKESADFDDLLALRSWCCLLNYC